MALVVASKETGPEVIAEKTTYGVMSRDKNAEQNSNIKVRNNAFKRVEQFKYLETTLINKISIHQQIKGRLKSGTSFRHSVQNLLSSSLLFKKCKY